MESTLIKQSHCFCDEAYYLCEKTGIYAKEMMKTSRLERDPTKMAISLRRAESANHTFNVVSQNFSNMRSAYSCMAEENDKLAPAWWSERIHVLAEERGTMSTYPEETIHLAREKATREVESAKCNIALCAELIKEQLEKIKLMVSHI